MKNFLLLVFISLTIVSLSNAETMVTYVSSEGIYINAGTNAGLQKGDTLNVIRETQIIAIIVIENISTKSSACKIISQTEALNQNDIVLKSDGSQIVFQEEKLPDRQTILETKIQKAKASNRLRGYIALQQYYQKDFTNSSLSAYQPSIKTKLKVDNIGNSNLTFKLSMRSRYYHRSAQISVSGDKDEWSHRLYEFAIYADNGNLQWSFGRQSVYQARGVGYIDGLYLSKQLNQKISIGGAVGSEPDYLNQKIDFNRKKAAIFLSYEDGTYESGKYILSAAFAGSYHSSEVNREFFNFAADYYSNSFSTNHAVEIDMFRTWRKDAIGSTFKFANYYGRLNYKLSDKIRFHLSYDNRHQIRYLDDVYIADSLFDNNEHQGVGFGTSIKFSQKMTFTGNTGIRFRSDKLDDNKFINTSVTIANFPSKRNSLSVRFAYVNTMFTDAYRPSISFRFPLSKIYLTTTASSNIYKSATATTTNTYLDMNSYYSFGRIYFFSGSIRQYLDSELRSTQLYIELGRNF